MAPPPHPGLDSSGSHDQGSCHDRAASAAVNGSLPSWPGASSAVTDHHVSSGDDSASSIPKCNYRYNNIISLDGDNTTTNSAADTMSSSLQGSEASYPLLEHPAIVFASNRLADPAYTAGFRSLAVFDFDQTLFQSPLPNPALWDPAFIGVLTTWNYCGTGWWHNPGTLELGPAIEESVWDGWWNEHVVEQVIRCSQNPECLTILLTGRNGPTFGAKLVQMVQAKGLDFDIIATKPTTVAKLEPGMVLKGYSKLPASRSPNVSRRCGNGESGNSPSQYNEVNGTNPSAQKTQEEYLKIHTFNAKHDFLYNVLFEYPSIRSMTLWDDRPCQISKFRQAGNTWLNQKMLDHFEIHVVQEPLQYLDLQREYNLVMAMIEENNKQVEIEASGGPYLVPGIGPILRTRPELEQFGLWDPYETYRPTPRERIDVGKVTRYTGVMFSKSIQAFLAKQGQICEPEMEQYIERPSSLANACLRKWVVPDDMHVTLCMGSAHSDHLKQLGGMGATVFVEIVAKGAFEERIWALKVKEFEVPSAYLSTTASNGTTPGHPTPLPAPVNEGQDGDDEEADDSDDVLVVAPSGKIYNSFAAFWKAHYKPPQPKDRRSTDGERPHMAVRRRSTLRVWTVDVSKVDLERIGHMVLSRPETTPHITMAYDRLNGTRAVESGKISAWEPISDLRDSNDAVGEAGGDRHEDEKSPKKKVQKRIVLVGTIGEKKLIGLKSTKHGQQATTPRAEVSIAKVLMGIHPQKLLPGPRLGELIKRVKEQMDKQQVANLSENQSKIEAIAREVWEQDEVMAQVRGGDVEGKDEVQGPA
ncbi:hypothetical protein BGW41_000280 [Actinomortierella wolfii]|nr:hypothetical protein BGW41_000280 [Actinomortierella wolfii]